MRCINTDSRRVTEYSAHSVIYYLAAVFRTLSFLLTFFRFFRFLQVQVLYFNRLAPRTQNGPGLLSRSQILRQKGPLTPKISIFQENSKLKPPLFFNFSRGYQPNFAPKGAPDTKNIDFSGKFQIETPIIF